MIVERAGNIQDLGPNNAAGAVRVLKDDGTTELWAVRPSGLLYPGGVARYDYDFAVDGGAVSTITLRNGPALPVGTIIYGGLCRVETAFTTGSTTTVAVSSGEAANDLITAASVAGAPWSTTGTKAIVPVMTAASVVVTTGQRAPVVVIGTAAATAGKFTLLLFVMKANA